MRLVPAPQGRIARSRAKSPASPSILLLLSALLSWARSARAEQDGGAPDEPMAGPPIEVSYEATVRASRQSATAQTTIVDADRFAGALDDDQAIVSNFIAGNIVGVDFRTGARP